MMGCEIDVVGRAGLAVSGGWDESFVSAVSSLQVYFGPVGGGVNYSAAL